MVRSPMSATLPQLRSRLFVTRGIPSNFPETRTHILESSLVIGWSITSCGARLQATFVTERARLGRPRRRRPESHDVEVEGAMIAAIDNMVTLSDWLACHSRFSCSRASPGHGRRYE
ncbi:hypothetical protein CFC21_010189 [Triticum aestivum]|uniref:Uncharacterized protein n=2 Tax=Triticum aestivum TaxID=4565 RepID=A0A3B5ZP47_WHEAT|nr:hypothetical protein CFC21_010189 [Triticum aestivum]